MGKIGLGALAISPAEDYLYVVNLLEVNQNPIPTSNPTAANTVEISIPILAVPMENMPHLHLKYYNDKLYVGVTCYEQTSQSAANSAAVVYEMDLNTSNIYQHLFNNLFKGLLERWTL